MKLHIDMLTPKQVLFFGEVAKISVERLKCRTLITTRRYREVDELLKIKRIEAVTVGEHGGSTRQGKLEAGLRRTLKLADLLADEQPNVSLSFSSPEAARASFGLGIPHIAVNDSPHAEAVARLTLPLSKKLLFPRVIPRCTWLRLGATPRILLSYRALDPVVWLRRYKPDSTVLRQLDLADGEPFLVVRTEETYASYMLHKASGGELAVTPAIKALLGELADKIRVVVIPRYKDQASLIRSALGDTVSVAEHALDTTSLLAFTSIFIGGGGTMTAEAALLGVPSFSIYPSTPTYVDKYLIRMRLVERITQPKLLAKKVAATLRDLSAHRRFHKQKAEWLMARMEDPVEHILATVSRYL